MFEFEKESTNPEILVVFTEHRPEYLSYLERIFERAEIIILEEPHTLDLEKALRGELSPEAYADRLYTEFPLYIKEQINLLRKLHVSRKVKVLGCEPYLEKLLKIYDLISLGISKELLTNIIDRDGLAKIVYNVENLVSNKLIKYYYSLMEGDFRKVVEAIVEFARVDSLRILMRDLLRAIYIKKIIEDVKCRGIIVIEAGVMHTVLPIVLRKLLKLRLSCINIKSLLLKRLNLKPLPHPGYMLSNIFMHGLPYSQRFVRLLAARSFVYNMIILKKEVAPTDRQLFPHIIQEYRVLQFVNKLRYEDCERIYKIYYKKVIKREVRNS